MGRLHEQLGVEAEVERVAQERDREQQLAAVGAVARVQVGELGAAVTPVLDRGQDAVGDPLVERHARRPGRARLGHARAEHQVGLAAPDRLDQLRDQRRLVLAVGVQHHHDVRPALERLEVAGLLVAAVADVVGVPDHVTPSPRAISSVSSVERSSTRITSSTQSRGIARDGRSSVFAAFSAGITTIDLAGRSARLAQPRRAST